MKQLLKISILSFSLLGLGSSYAQEATPERQEWSFSGINGQYDKAQLRRGLQVYEEKCRACHGIKHLSFRSLTRPAVRNSRLKKQEVSPAAISFLSFRMTARLASETGR